MFNDMREPKPTKTLATEVSGSRYETTQIALCPEMRQVSGPADRNVRDSTS